MRLLLDTRFLIWSVFESVRLKPNHVEMLAEPANDVVFSAASIWEVAIKKALGKSDFDNDPRRLLDLAMLDFDELPVTPDAAAGVVDLPHIHRDPFDRLLVAQAIDADAVLLTADSVLAAYGPRVLLAR